MKIRKVSYFLALCEERSFTRAAKRCGVAQPSLTRAIQLLEQEIGGQLFERSNSSVCLTKLGMLVRPDFLTISQAAQNIEHTVSNFSASNMTNSNYRAMERYMRAFAIALVTISIFAVGLTFHPTVPATAVGPDHMSTQVDPYGLQSSIDGHSLPTQKIQDLF